MKLNEFIFTTLLCICFLALGIAGTKIYEYVDYNKQYNGLWLSGYKDKPAVLERASQYEPYGDWVCINMRGSTYQENLDTCSHEVGHEMFAQKCAENATKCLEVIDGKK